MVAANSFASITPVLSDEAFSIPTRESLHEKSMLISHFPADHEDLIRLIMEIFTRIAVVFQPNRASNQDLEIRCKDIANRIFFTTAPTRSLTGYWFATSSIDGSKDEGPPIVLV